MFYSLQAVTVLCRWGLVFLDLQIWETLSRTQLAQCFVVFSVAASPKTTNICSSCLMSPGIQPNVLMHNLVKEHAALAFCVQHGQHVRKIYKLLKTQRCCSANNSLELYSIRPLLRSNQAPSPHLASPHGGYFATTRVFGNNMGGNNRATFASQLWWYFLNTPARWPQPCIFSLFLFLVHILNILKTSAKKKKLQKSGRTLRSRPFASVSVKFESLEE